jgi:transposase
VAKALDIHPVMLSRWRQEAREGRLQGTSSRVERVPRVPVRELKRLQALERAHALLQEEHELLKKAIRFCSEQRRTSSRSSKDSEERSN